MTQEETELLDRINTYANEVLADIDPQKTAISYQLEKLKPIMAELAKEKNTTIEDIFIQYMDLASISGAKKESDLQESLHDETLL